MPTLSLQKLCHGVRVNARRLEQGVDINILIRSMLSHRLTGEQWPKGHCARNEPRVCATTDGKALRFCARILCVRLLECLDQWRGGVDVVWRAVMHNRELDLGPQQLLDELVGDLFACDRDRIPDVDDRGAVVMVDMQSAQVEREDTRDLIRKVDAHTMSGPLGTDLACKELQGLVVFETVHGVQHLQQLADGVATLLGSRRMRWHAFHVELQLAVCERRRYRELVLWQALDQPLQALQLVMIGDQDCLGVLRYDVGTRATLGVTQDASMHAVTDQLQVEDALLAVDDRELTIRADSGLGDAILLEVVVKVGHSGLFVGAKQEHDRVPGLDVLCLQRRTGGSQRKNGGDGGSLVVGGASAIETAVLDGTGKRGNTPARSFWYDVDMAQDGILCPVAAPANAADIVVHVFGRKPTSFGGPEHELEGTADLFAKRRMRVGCRRVFDRRDSNGAGQRHHHLVLVFVEIVVDSLLHLVPPLPEYQEPESTCCKQHKEQVEFLPIFQYKQKDAE